MSQENVEIVRRAWEAFARNDNVALFPVYHPEVEIHGGFTNQVYRGLNGAQEWADEWLAAFDQYRSEVEEWIDAGDDVIVVVRSWGRGKRSAVEVEARASHVWTLREGRLWRLRTYETKDEALKAVGLEE